MKDLEYRKFVDEHREALKLLSEKIRSIDTVIGVDTLYEMRGRKHAISLIDEWLHELWSITTSDLPPIDNDDDGLFRIIE